nr:hypothetical protein [Elizabethkingia bruuniana]
MNDSPNGQFLGSDGRQLPTSLCGNILMTGSSDSINRPQRNCNKQKRANIASDNLTCQ